MKNRIASLLLAVVILVSLSMTGAAAEQTEPPEPEEPKSYTVDTESGIYAACQEAAQGINASQILVYDATADEILYTKTVEGGKLYPASITKLFTSYVALQYLDPAEVVKAGDELAMVQAGSSMAYIYRGQRVTVQMAVEAMLLPSGNDAAMILAAAAGRRIAGDESLAAGDAVKAFVAEMNRQAEALGFEKSHFANPDGYHVGCHYTCVNDMARIAKLALENETISKYMRYQADDVVYASGQNNHWENTNLLLQPASRYYRPDAIGMKTGSTSQAGFCLMSAFQVGESTLVIGIFGCPEENERFAGTIQLADACKAQWKNR